MNKKKRKKKRLRPVQRKPRTPGIKFPVGTKIRVKPGTLAPDYADIPLGGWTGTIQEVGSHPVAYFILWNQETLDQMHPVYRKRCLRDDLDVDSMWLGEDDLEFDTGAPAKFEQPQHLVTRPLSRDDPDDRIRAIFGLSSDDPLPDINVLSLRDYHRYLETHLSFPFQAKYVVETGPFEEEYVLVTVTGLVDADECEDVDGVRCVVAEHEIELPLYALESTINLHNRTLIDDYANWFQEFPGDGNSREITRATSAFLPSPFAPAPTLSVKRAFLNLILTYVLGGTISGMTLGAVLAAMEMVQFGAIVGAAVLGAIGLVFGITKGISLGQTRSTHSYILPGGLLGAVAGILFGAVIGSLLGASIGIVIGMVIGRLMSKWLLKSQSMLIAMALGAAVCAIAQAFYFHPEMAREGAMYGAIVGAIAGIAMLPVTIGLMFWYESSRTRG